MFYDRKIKYLDYLENKERCKGAGFAKIEVREESCNVTIQVSGLPLGENSDREVFLLDEQKEGRLGTVKLANGRGSLMLPNLQSGCMGQTGISYGKLVGIRIPLGANREIYCAWNDRVSQAVSNHEEEKAPVRERSENVAGVLRAVLSTAVKMPVDKTESESTGALSGKAEAAKMPVDATGAAEIPGGGTGAIEIYGDETETAEIPGDRNRTGAAMMEKVAVKEAFAKEPAADKGTKMKAESVKTNRAQKQPVKLQENKWQQLSFIYPHIKPFHDERDYISIGPADFVVLPEKYYRMANNSFLLHGYYNYEHLILARVEQRGQIIYYIGVPGNFYDREKQVAVMFGFESFECMEEPAKEGDFGYYMMRLEL